MAHWVKVLNARPDDLSVSAQDPHGGRNRPMLKR